MTTPPSRIAELSRGSRAHELAAIVLLTKAKLVPMERLSALIEDAGSAVSVLLDLDAQQLARFTSSELQEAISRVERWMRAGVDVRMIFDPSYPRNLLSVYNKPPLLFVKGTWDEVRDATAVAVVGTRSASSEGLKRARSVAGRLARAGITVTSGLARGIDTAAHSAALKESGRTIAVLGTGIDKLYPSENEDLAARILSAGGALISQFFPEQPPTGWTFPMRNVVMSGLSIATLVIEASATSGAKSQARHALEHGRTVFLPKSLVETHSWAYRMISEGVHGVKAIQVDSGDEVVDRITSSAQDDLVLAV